MSNTAQIGKGSCARPFRCRGLRSCCFGVSWNTGHLTPIPQAPRILAFRGARDPATEVKFCEAYRQRLAQLGRSAGRVLNPRFAEWQLGLAKDWTSVYAAMSLATSSDALALRCQLRLRATAWGGGPKQRDSPDQRTTMVHHARALRTECEPDVKHDLTM